MEPSKFEKHIKAKLNERSINPSAGAWDKIVQELPTHTKTRKTSNLLIAIAASFLVLIGTVFVYFRSDTSLENNPAEAVVGAKEKIVEKTIVPIVPSEVETEEEPIIVVLKNNCEQENKEQKIPEVIIQGQISAEKTGVANEVITLNAASKELNDKLKKVLVSENILNSKIAEVVAKVNAIELSNTVTDAEVDALLLEAQQEILKENLFNIDNSVDAMALLTEVEDELDQSFRDQIFQSLKSGFLKMRTAVADRNN